MAARAVALESASRVMSKAITSVPKLSGAATHRDWLIAANEVMATSVELTSLLVRDWPTVSLELQGHINALADEMGKDEPDISEDNVVDAISGLVLTANGWLMKRPGREWWWTRRDANMRAAEWTIVAREDTPPPPDPTGGSAPPSSP